jgi:hypothetical protein
MRPPSAGGSKIGCGSVVLRLGFFLGVLILGEYTNENESGLQALCSKSYLPASQIRRCHGFDLDQEAVMQFAARYNCARRAILPKNA